MSTEPGTPIRIRVEGPYGVDWGAVATERLQAGAAVKSAADKQHGVLMIAGGVGISPLCSIIANLLSTAPAALARLHVLWSIRDDAVLRMYMPALQRAADAGATITVHDTGAPASGSSFDLGATTTAAATPTASVLTPSAYDPRSKFFAENSFLSSRSCGTPSKPPVTPLHRDAKQQQLLQHSKCKSFRAPWNVRSPLWSWFVSTTLLFLSTVGSNAGFLASRAVCSAHPITLPAAAAAAYEARVLANYAAAHSGASPANGWPNGQSRLANATVYEQRVLGQHSKIVMRCTPGTEPNASDPQWRYGQPAPCRNLVTTWMCPGVVTPLLSWGLSLLLALLGGLVFARCRAVCVATTATISKPASASAAVSSEECLTPPAMRRKSLPNIHAFADEGAFASSGQLVTVLAGRPDVDAYIATIADSLNSNGKCNILDVYVCGSEQLQDLARDAFKCHITPISEGSSFLGLQYAIG
jgi:Ferric reductase NAD binding domain